MSAHPYDYKFPMTLAGVVSKAGNEPLSTALLELAASKLLADPDEVERAREAGGAPARFTDLDSLTELVQELRGKRDSEPAEVTEELRPHRLLNDVQEAMGNELERGLVEEIVKSGAACAPLLVGMLRGLAEGRLPDGGEMVGEASLAMLGEIADIDAIPALVQFAVVDDKGLSQTAAWALERAAQKKPAEVLAAFSGFDRRMGAAERACMSENIATMPETSGKTEAILAMLDNFVVVPAEERGDIFVMISAALLHCRGKNAPALIRKAYLDQKELLPKEAEKSIDDLLRAYAADPALFEIPAETPSTVYDICCADRLSGYSDEEDEAEDEEGHVHGPNCGHAPEPPGRNDPCWCGSGKKYKKCHLESDEEERRKPAEAE
jgi:hypothetical protein